jgi:hypothetical protein
MVMAGLFVQNGIIVKLHTLLAASNLRTYAKLFQQGALPQAVRLYGKAVQRRWSGFA